MAQSESEPTRLRVLHLTGSAVSDQMVDLSLLYARGALDALEASHGGTQYATFLAHVSPDGQWRFPDDLSTETIEAAPPMSLADAISRLVDLRIDLVVPQMFCLPGMTTYRSLMDALGLRVLGNPADVMALGAHKARARAVVSSAGVSVPRGELLRAGDPPTLAPPVVIKPVDADNSVGVTLVREDAAYHEALRGAFAHSREVLVEEFVELGREVRCGVLDRGGELLCLPLEEYAVDPLTKPIRGEDDKLRRGDDGQLGLVAKDAEHAWIVEGDDPVVPAVHEAARRAHRAMGCRDYSLIDLRIDPAGEPWFLEASLYCSFAPTSVLAVMAGSAAIGVDELFASLAASAVK
ncbi:MAG: hypothetical protein WBG57_00400 [Ornithinimicrobium sp.]